MTPEAFERLVEQALAGLPEEFRRRLENVAVLVEARPSRRLLRRMKIPRGETLLGLYEGTPPMEQSPADEFNIPLPHKITLFQGPIEEACGSDEEIVHEVQETVKHEVGHYFGLSDEEMPG